MSAANPNPMEKSMVSVLVIANTGGGGRRCCVVFFGRLQGDNGEQTHNLSSHGEGVNIMFSLPALYLSFLYHHHNPTVACD
jgi:hypothetical protein